MSAVFYRGMVVDIISSVSGLTLRNKSIKEYQALVNSENLKSFPRNTAVVKQISEGASKTNDAEVICYPFFSSHLCMPLKPGECVWFVYENPDNRGSIAYWLSRITEPGHTDDVNHTLFARSYRQAIKQQAPSTAERFNGESNASATSQTFSFVSPTGNPDELIDTIGFANQVCRIESIPRYNKRPGDLVIQGSNNSLIMLGEERGHYAESAGNIVSSANTTDIPPGLAAIDIVVGRGRSAATSGTQIFNELGLPELDKRKDPPTEGDPHFPTDASRLYLTANSTDIFLDYHPDILLNIETPSTTGLETQLKDVLGRRAGSFFVGKADNLRLVARKSGDVRITKEPGKPKDLDGVAVILHTDGVLQASGKKISLSSYNSEGGATEPYVRYTELMSLISSMIDDYASIASDINDFCTSLTSVATTLTSGGGLSTPAAPGAPVTVISIPAAGGQLSAAAATLQAKAVKIKATTEKKKIDIDINSFKIKSSIIFGE